MYSVMTAPAPAPAPAPPPYVAPPNPVHGFLGNLKAACDAAGKAARSDFVRNLIVAEVAPHVWMSFKIESYDPGANTAVVDIMVYLANAAGGPPAEPLTEWIDCQGRVGAGAGATLTKREGETDAEKEKRRAQKGQKVHFFPCSPHEESSLPARSMLIEGRHCAMAIKLDDVHLGRGFRRLDQLHFYAVPLQPGTRRCYAAWADLVEPRGWKGFLEYHAAKAMLEAHPSSEGILFHDGTEASQEIWINIPGLTGAYLIVNYDKNMRTGAKDIDLKVVLTEDAPAGLVVDMRYAGLVGGVSGQATPTDGASEVKGIIYDSPRPRTLEWRNAAGLHREREVNMVQVSQIDDLMPPVDLELFFVDIYQALPPRESFTLADTPFGPAIAKQLGVLCRKSKAGRRPELAIGRDGSGAASAPPPPPTAPPSSTV